MKTFEYLLELAGGLVLLIGTGYLVGHLLRLGRLYEELNKKEGTPPGDEDPAGNDPGEQHQPMISKNGQQHDA